MGYSWGFEKEKYAYNTPWDERVYYFEGCGWENVNLHNLFSYLGKKHLVFEEGYEKVYEYEIEVEKLAFIEQVYRQVTANKNYNIIIKLCYFGDDFVDDYVNALSIKEKAALRIAFLAETDNDTVIEICVELFDKFEYGYDIVGNLYLGYQKMLEDGVKTVWLYGD